MATQTFNGWLVMGAQRMFEGQDRIFNIIALMPDQLNAQLAMDYHNKWAIDNNVDSKFFISEVTVEYEAPDDLDE